MSISDEPITMAALGRPFILGMLYDCRSDKLIPGMTLWNPETLEKNAKLIPEPYTNFTIVASESISDKSSSLGVEASLKASFCGGLIEVGGSAKYLNNKKTSKQQARITLMYKTTTEFKELTMTQLGKDNIQHPDVFDKKLATHVVTGILYGAQAFFVFDRELSDTDNVQDIEGNLKATFNKIPGLSVGGEASVKMNNEEKEKVNKFSCTFIGDFNLEQNPATFDDAVKVFKELPEKLGPNKENVVPVTVWLLPLTVLDSAAAKLERQLSAPLVSEVERTLEAFGDLEMRCNDALNSANSNQLPQIVTKIKQFQQLWSVFRMDLQVKVKEKLPLIRGGAEDEAELAEILKKRAAFPFSDDCLNEWLSCKVKEINLIKTYKNLMKKSESVSSQTELEAKSLDIKYKVCFVFTSLGNEESYLTALHEYQKDKTGETSPRHEDIKKDQWFSSRDVQEEVRQRAMMFGDMAEANQDNEEIKFFTVGFKDENHKHSTIYLYEDGFEKSDNFQPLKPKEVKVDEITENSVSLSFQAPTSGAEAAEAAVKGYRVEYCESGGEWKHQTKDEVGTVVVEGLTPETEYSFRVRAVTDVGLGPAAEVKPIKTSPTLMDFLAKDNEMYKAMKRQGL